MPLLTYLITKGELTPKEINVNCILMFRAGVETVNIMEHLYLLLRISTPLKLRAECLNSLLSPLALWM